MGQGLFSYPGIAGLNSAPRKLRRVGPAIQRPMSVSHLRASELSAETLARKQVVFLGSQKIGDAGAAIVGAALAARDCAILSVNLDSCLIGCDGAVALAEGMKRNSTLEELVMLDNEVGDEGAAALAGALSSPGTSVRCLSLAGNRIGSLGGIALGSMLAANKSLQTVYLMGQEKKGGGIGDMGAAAWADGIAANHGNFWFVNLNNNHISEAGLELLRNARIEGKHHVYPVDPYPR